MTENNNKNNLNIINNYYKENINYDINEISIQLASITSKNLKKFNLKEKFINDNLNSSKIFDYNTLLKNNSIENKEMDFIINDIVENDKYSKIDKNYIIKNNYKPTGSITSNTKLKNNFKNVLNIFDYNKNLYIINSLKSENLNLLYFEDSNYIKYKKYELTNKNYFSSLINSINENIKIKMNNKIFEHKMISNEIIDNLKKFPDNNFAKSIRYRKTKEEKKFLREFFNSHSYRWSKKILAELSEKLLLSEYSLYKWNWDQLKKRNLI